MRGMLNENAVSYVPQVYHQFTQMPPLSRDFSNYQVFIFLIFFLLSCTFCKMDEISLVKHLQQKKSYASVKAMNEELRRRQSETHEMQKHNLRERLYPLVEKLKGEDKADWSKNSSF